MADESFKPRSPVPAIERGMRLLTILGTSKEGLTLAELSRESGIARSSTLNLCRALVAEGLVSHSGNNRYLLGPATMVLAQKYAHTGLPTQFDRLGNIHLPEAKDSIVLALREFTTVTYLAQRRGSMPLATQYHLGMKMPAHVTATGKASLSTLTGERIREIYLGYPDFTKPDELDQFVNEMAATRKRGYAIDDEQSGPGMVCIGVPLRRLDSLDLATVSIAVSLVKSTTSDEEIEYYVEKLKIMANALSQ